MPEPTFASQLDEYRAQLAEITRLQQERTGLMGVGTAAGRRVTVTVNADGIAIDIKFSSGVGDLGHEETAAAITAASQLAVADVARQTTALFAPIAPPRTEPLKWDETISGIAELRDQLR
ncbi:YbaB/EbfC family nucleoid-associated protein [Nocardia sp. NEAU-G5]|uniref:YbaB/EbfC family nucleoid-associated protein n=1 Tax=Nocardia albiluteola TaxID=2842303 RepID=A0ABS6B8B5_9NOCA|nr:YbaB/EbfC family nucleoid-associated protein [Nocardia albiluteola]MBU3066504.1 YbaB/EbfC family nucleoid-associated protein [Nocardia albiluteola]